MGDRLRNKQGNMETQKIQSPKFPNGGVEMFGMFGNAVESPATTDKTLYDFWEAVSATRKEKEIGDNTDELKKLSEEEVLLAIEEDRILPVLQPIVPIGTNAVVGEGVKYECLMRIKDTSGKLIPPISFLKVLDNNKKLAQQAASMMIEKSLRIAKEQGIHISLNFGDAEGEFPYLTKFLEQKMKELGVKPNQITVELLEKIKKVDFDAVAYLKDIMGVGISVDDFGAKLSNQKRVEELACFLDTVKVDMTLTKGLLTDVDNMNLIKELFEFILEEQQNRQEEGDNSCISVVFEGVETKDEMEITKALAEEYGIIAYWQGFGIERPSLPLKLFTDAEKNMLHLSGEGYNDDNKINAA